jgi:hypothetical protein
LDERIRGPDRKQAKDAGHEVTYWQQAASGKWEKRA